MNSAGTANVIICGSRTWDNYSAVQHVIDKLAKLTPLPVIIHGNARGADKLSGSYARLAGLQLRVFPAPWKQYGKRAGSIRNQTMLDRTHPELVIYFTEDRDNPTAGTADMVKRAHESGVRVVWWKDYLNDQEAA